MASSSEIMEREEPIRPEEHYPNVVHRTFRMLALERGLLAEKIEDACIIVYAMTKRYNCVGNTSVWDMGQNHLLFDYGDKVM